MTVPFENDTGNIVRKLARKSLKSEKRRNLMVVIAVALASCLICFSIVMALSTRQIEKNHVEDTYEAVYTRITEEDVSTLKGLDDFSRVGEYYMLAVEPAEQGYNASYIYCDEETMYIARDQMKLLEGRLPQKEDEVVVSRYFLSNYAADAGIGEKVMLSSESFHGEYTVTGIMEGYKEKEVNGSSILLSKEALKGWSGYDPADYRAYVHFKNEQQMDETELTARSREIAKEYQLEMPIMNLSYMKFYKQPVNVSMLALVAGIAVLVIIGGYVVIQSIFRISINDKIQSYGQLRTIGTTPKQIRRIVKKEGRFLGWAGIGIGILLGELAGYDKYCAELAGMESTGKMMALTECGYIPDPEGIKAANTMWLYYMVWNGDFIYETDAAGKAMVDLNGTPHPNPKKGITNEMLAEYFSNDLYITHNKLPEFSFGVREIPQQIKNWEYFRIG